MKRIPALLLAALMLTSFAACSKDKEDAPKDESYDIESSAVESSEGEESSSADMESSEIVAESSESAEDSSVDTPESSTPEESSATALTWTDSSVAAVVGDVPSPQSAYTITSVTEKVVCFELADDNGVEEWKQIIQILSDFKYIKEEGGVIYYGNATHSIEMNGKTMTVTLK